MKTTTVKVNWTAFDLLDAPKQPPEIQRTCAVTSDGEVFVNALCGGPRAALCALHDGVPMLSHKRHTFVPVKWVIANYPHTAKALRRIERAMRKDHRPSP